MMHIAIIISHTFLANESYLIDMLTPPPTKRRSSVGWIPILRWEAGEVRIVVAGHCLDIGL